MKNTNLKTIATVRERERERERESYNFKREKIIEKGAHRGITLIALIITIIVLLILAGVALNFIVGQNGILTHSETSKQQYELASAREELEMVIADIQTEILKTEGRKATLADLENKIDKNKYSIILSTDPIATTTAVSTSYTYATVVELEKEIEFTVDAKLIIREVELVSVKQGTAEVEIGTKIKSYVGKDENEKYRVKYEITLSTMQGVKSIIVESGEEKQELTIDENLTKEVSVEIGKVYTITVTMEDGKYKRKTIYDRATETIKTAEELAQFRDKVNSGLSYEGKTVELANDIDLQGSEENQWTPIETFSGTFSGNYHKISNINIENDKKQGLGFFYNLTTKAKVENLLLEDIYINNTYSIAGKSLFSGGIAARSSGIISNCGINKGNITGNKKVSSTTWSLILAGGIVGSNSGTIINCYNKANINSTGFMDNSYTEVVPGGIVGENVGIVKNCYNAGVIYASGNTIEEGGIIGRAYKVNGVLENSYNVGAITKTTGKSEYIAGLIGRNGWSSSYNSMPFINSYCTNETTYSTKGYVSTNSNRLDKEQLKTYATTLGSAYTNDVKIKVKEEITGEEKEVWKYNNGYPILKWQLENN